MAHTLRSYHSEGVMLPLLELSWISSQLRNPGTGDGGVTMSVVTGTMREHGVRLKQFTLDGGSTRWVRALVQ
jgi:hypothetical protein